VNDGQSTARPPRQDKRLLKGSFRRRPEIDTNDDVVERPHCAIGAAWRHDQNRLRRPEGDAFGDRSGAESIETCSPVCSHDDEVWTSRAGVQEDDPGRVAVLNADVEGHPPRLCSLSQPGNQRHTRLGAPRKCFIGGDGVYYRKFCAMPPRQRERLFECRVRRLREINSDKNARQLLHRVTPSGACIDAHPEKGKSRTSCSGIPQV
jgi:hypothetical protein